MLIYIYLKSRHEKSFSKWRLISDLLIRKAVFYEEEDEGTDLHIPITQRTQKLLENVRFRKLLTDELIKARKNITGISAENLKHLYKQLKFDQYAINDLSSYFWYVKAKAIQELAIMDMREYLTRIYRYTNNRNDFVRMEAQTAVVQFYGFEGLRFLDVVSYPISDWQQIKLLEQLSHVPPANISIDNWLKSSNPTVVVFALKLARNYHRFELHDLIVLCLVHENAEVRLQAIHCLGEMYTEDTSKHLISRFWIENFKHQLAIVKVLQKIGTEEDIPFLLRLLDYDNNELKINTARALADIGKAGLESLESHYHADDFPLNEIIIQIKGEVAA